MKLLSWTQSVITDVNKINSDYWGALYTEYLAFDVRVARYYTADAGSVPLETSTRRHILNDHRDNLESLALL
jgi:hypothetical protein